MYKIGELSKLCQLPVKTLRYYDSIGLLVPDEIDRVDWKSGDYVYGKEPRVCKYIFVIE